jgi:hypothetical protein
MAAIYCRHGSFCKGEKRDSLGQKVGNDPWAGQPAHFNRHRKAISAYREEDSDRQVRLDFQKLSLTFVSLLRYTASMPIHFILPKKFTRADIEWQMDQLALRFQGTKDKKLIGQIAALNRLLVKMDSRNSDSSLPKNRQ